MKKFIIFSALLLMVSAASGQNNTIIDSLISIYNKGDEEKVTFKDGSKKDIEIIRSYLNFLRNTNTDLNTFKGKLNFSFKLQDSESQEQTDFVIGANVTKGVFPGEFKFNSQLNVQLLNGKFIENVSNLSMSYDHHLDNDIDTEGYIFLRRSSNNYLNIDQRYEVGAGFTFNFYSGELATKKKNDENKLDKVLKDDGIKKFKKLFAFSGNEEKILDGSYAPFCDDEDCEKNELSGGQIKEFNKLYHNITTGIKKQQSLWRLSVLAGINYEAERTKDSLNLRYVDSLRRKSFDPKQLIRLVVGPKVEFQINEFNFESVCYVKLGVFNDNFEDEVMSPTDIDNPLSDSRTDYRVEWNTTASVKVSKKISISATLAYTWINAPSRAYYLFPETGDTYQLFSTDQRYLNFTAGLEYKL